VASRSSLVILPSPLLSFYSIHAACVGAGCAWLLPAVQRLVGMHLGSARGVHVLKTDAGAKLHEILCVAA
jgi:hypothetical protein